MGYAITQPVDLSGLARESAANRIETDAAAVRGLDLRVPERDEFFWPSLSGESFGPTLFANGTYGSWRGRPCMTNVAVAGATVRQVLVRWPLVPRVSAKTGKTTLGLSLLVARALAAEMYFGFGISSAAADLPAGEAGVRVQALENGDWQLKSHDGGAQEVTGLPGFAPDVAWSEIEIRLELAAVALLINGVERARHVTRFWAPTADNASLYPHLGWATSAARGTNAISVSQLRARWE